ncbi:hypothetical protein HDV06_000490 [Boothiomyces sp. JEL0866]|nr:hypothetical protein HDV06_000490 [Boothiomyces sp. JEL0866]
MQLYLLTLAIASTNAMYIRDVTADAAQVQTDKAALANDAGFQKLVSDKKAAHQTLKADITPALKANPDFQALKKAHKTLHQTAKKNNVTLKNLQPGQPSGNADVDAALKAVSDLEAKLSSNADFQKLQADKKTTHDAFTADKAALANDQAFQTFENDRKKVQADLKTDKDAVKADKAALANDAGFQKLETDKKAAHDSLKADKTALKGDADVQALHKAQKALHQAAKKNNVNLKSLQPGQSSGNADVDAAMKAVSDLKAKLSSNAAFQKLQNDKKTAHDTITADKAALANDAGYQKLAADQKQLHTDKKAAHHRNKGGNAAPTAAPAAGNGKSQLSSASKSMVALGLFTIVLAL